MPRPKIPEKDRKIPQGVSMFPHDIEYLNLAFPTFSLSDAVHAAIEDSKRLRLDQEGDHA